MHLSLESINFAYHQHKLVIRDFDLEIESGEVLAILGPSGCGKTTLLRIIAGVLQKGSGDRDFGGRISYGDADDPVLLRRSHRLGYMFQTPMLFPYLTVRQNIAFPFKNGAVQDGEIDRLVDLMGLRGSATAYPSTLSGGMRTRVALARTFVTAPQLLLLDEPFSSLDIAWRLALYNELIAARSVTRPTTILVTHDISEALLLSDRIALMGMNGSLRTLYHPESKPPRPITLAAMRVFLDRHHSVISEIQFAINADVVAARQSAGTLSSHE